MNNITTLTSPTFLSVINKTHGLVKNILIVIVSSIVIWISAKIQIPFYPVPITMQTFIVLMIGMAYGWKMGGLTILLYLLEGVAGLPVFSGTPEKGIGLAYMIGPTGGYLFGFIVSVYIVGKLAEKGWDRNFFLTFIAMIVGNIVIYIFGIAWLGLIVGWDKPILAWGVFPFLLGDFLKIILASILMPSLWKLVKKKNHRST